MSTISALQSFEEKRKLVECLTIGTTINTEKKKADIGVTKNKFRNSNSDEANQVVYDNFKDLYSIDTYKENGYEHIRMYSVENKVLYVLLRETTFQEQLEKKDDSNLSLHYLLAYSYINRWMVKDAQIPTGQLVFLDEGIVSHKELLIQKKVKEVMKGKDVDVVQLITYDVIRGKVVSVKARVLKPDIASTPLFEEDWSHYIVSYDNKDETVGFVVEPKYQELSEEMQQQAISELLTLKTKQKDVDKD